MNINRLKKLAGIIETYHSDFDDVAPEEKGNLYGVSILPSPTRPDSQNQLSDWFRSLPSEDYSVEPFIKAGSSNISYKVDCHTKQADKELIDALFSNVGGELVPHQYFIEGGKKIGQIIMKKLQRPEPPKHKPKTPELKPELPKPSDIIH